MKIKVIDLLNMISRGKEVPKEIKYCAVYYYWTGFNYENSEADEVLFWSCIYSEKYLNDEVEIIEDRPKEDKKIERIKWDSAVENFKQVNTNTNDIIIKINEIIDHINKEDKG